MTPEEAADALGEAYQIFWSVFGYWPTVAVTVGTVVYLGAYA
jgi:hypothetical protein